MFSSTEWFRIDFRKIVIGVDLDFEVFIWCMENNVYEVIDDDSFRILFFYGNVL